ncbi:MAG: response regulator [Campylobacterota bacterium]|nr:response regulator [Campylobacterota bacterium]
MSDAVNLRDKIKGFKVLFVDDEEEIHKGTGLFLSKFFDDVIICVNGEDGLETFKNTQEDSSKKNFDVIITDIKMPKMDGISMVKEIKNIRKDIFVVFITASRGSQKFDDNLSDIYIKKPLSYNDIILIMKQISELK